MPFDSSEGVVIDFCIYSASVHPTKVVSRVQLDEALLRLLDERIGALLTEQDLTLSGSQSFPVVCWIPIMHGSREIH